MAARGLIICAAPVDSQDRLDSSLACCQDDFRPPGVVIRACRLVLNLRQRVRFQWEGLVGGASSAARREDFALERFARGWWAPLVPALL